MSEHEQNGSPEEMYEPDGTSATALFFVVGFLFAGVFVICIVIWQWYAVEARAQMTEKGIRPNPALIELEDSQRAELESWGEVGCPDVPVAAGAEPAAAAEGDPDAPPCSASEMIYHRPVDDVINDVLKDKALMEPGPAPATAPATGAAANPHGGAGNNANPQAGARPAQRGRPLPQNLKMKAPNGQIREIVQPKRVERPVTP